MVVSEAISSLPSNHHFALEGQDLEDLPGNIRTEMTFKPVTHADEVLKLALLEKK